MKKFAVVEIGGSQYQITENDEFDINHLDEEKGKEIQLDKVLLYSNGEVKIGQPYLEDIDIKARVVDHFKGEKITVTKYRAKSRYRRKQGFRPSLTRLKITQI